MPMPRGSKRSHARLKEVQSGKAKTVSWEDVRRKAAHCCVASKPLRFHPEAEQGYLNSLSWH